MNIRDQEIERLVRYAQGLGVKVVFKNSPDSIKNSATWSLDGTLIELYVRKAETKCSIILSLVHELGHHLWFVYKKERKPDLKFEEAIERDNLDSITPKRIRNKLLNFEKEGVKFWDTIIIDTNIKIPKWRIDRAKELDIWQFEVYYEKGTYPSFKEVKLKSKELKVKYKE